MVYSNYVGASQSGSGKACLIEVVSVNEGQHWENVKAFGLKVPTLVVTIGWAFEKSDRWGLTGKKNEILKYRNMVKKNQVRAQKR